MYFNDIVKGSYGRKVAYANVSEITTENIVKVLGSCIGVFNTNKAICKYLWDYYKGDQPVLYRTKIVRDDIVNKVVENHAFEIVQFKTGQTYGEPIQIVGVTDDERITDAVNTFNNYTRVAHKPARDIECGLWQSATGIGYKAVQRTGKSDVPFRIIVPTPLDSFVIYSESTKEPLLAVQERKDLDGERYYLCFDEIYEYHIKNSKLVAFNSDKKNPTRRLHAFGGIPIVEYPNNAERMSDIELVITMLDAINEIQSNRADSIGQFVQSWIKFVNCEVDEKTFQSMKMLGALVVKSNNGDGNKADVDIMTQELNQQQTQVAKDDLWDNVLTISAIPTKHGGSGGDTQGATELRDGWDHAKVRARMKDPFVVESEFRLDNVILNVIRIQPNAKKCDLSIMDYEPHINHSPTDNMQIKVQALKMLLDAGINPLIAVKTVGLWSDPEQTYKMSKPYLDVLYKTIDDIAKETVPDYKAQQKKAEDLLKGE